MQASIFLIILPDFGERQQAIASQLDKHSLTFSWIEGVNGRQLDADTLRQVYSVERAEREGGRQLNPGEIGCALSHQKIYRAMLAQNIPLALVLEDDAALAADFGECLIDICANVDWESVDLLLLSHIQKYTAWGAHPIAANRELVKPLVAYNGNGYLVTRRGAEHLLSQLTPIYQPADCWNHLRRLRVLNIRGIVPYLVNHSSLSVDSLIGEALREAPVLTSIRYQPGRLLKRVFYDKFIYQILVKPLLRIRRQPMPW